MTAIRALQQQLGDPDAADAVRIAAYLECSDDTARRHLRRLVQAGVLTTRKAVPRANGGPRREVYDLVTGDDDAPAEDRLHLLTLPSTGYG